MRSRPAKPQPTPEPRGLEVLSRALTRNTQLVEAARTPGWPRPYADYNENYPGFPHRRLPIPWQSAEPIARWGRWTEWDDTTYDLLYDHDFCLCTVCGQGLTRIKLFGRLEEMGGFTTGTGMHPRCALLAYEFCPALRQLEADDAFYLYEGKGHGLEFEHDKDDEAIWEEMNRVRVAEPHRLISLAEIRQLARAQTAAQQVEAQAGAAEAGCPHATQARGCPRASQA